MLSRIALPWHVKTEQQNVLMTDTSFDTDCRVLLVLPLLQAERANTCLQRELHELRTSETAAQHAETGQLLHKLVEAKLQLAQADLSMQDLKRQLQREHKRHMQAQAKLTNLQSNFDCYIHEQLQAAASRNNRYA